MQASLNGETNLLDVITYSLMITIAEQVRK
jgi:hypothetical protein